MIKQRKLKFNSGLGPQLESLEKKWGTSEGQKVADKIKSIVKEYNKTLDGVKPLKPDDGLMAGVSRTAQRGPDLQVGIGKRILSDIETLVDHHSVVKKAGK